MSGGKTRRQAHAQTRRGVHNKRKQKLPRNTAPKYSYKFTQANWNKWVKKHPFKHFKFTHAGYLKWLKAHKKTTGVKVTAAAHTAGVKNHKLQQHAHTLKQRARNQHAHKLKRHVRQRRDP